MNIEFHGTGRAAGALSLAAERAGHAITSVRGRNTEARRRLEMLLDLQPGPPDLRIIAVADDAIASVAESMAHEPPVPTVHVSGSVGAGALGPLAAAPTGSFHPLQTLPDPIRGADRLAGAWIAVTADEPFASTLDALALSLGCHPFRLADSAKPLYHAAAAASANFTLAALGLAERLYRAAGVPFEAAAPLVEAVVTNGFELGPSQALTGPIARDDRGTVRRQLAAVADTGTDNLDMFRAMGTATAIFAAAASGMREEFE